MEEHFKDVTASFNLKHVPDWCEEFAGRIAHGIMRIAVECPFALVDPHSFRAYAADEGILLFSDGSWDCDIENLMPLGMSAVHRAFVKNGGAQVWPSRSRAEDAGRRKPAKPLPIVPDFYRRFSQHLESRGCQVDVEDRRGVLWRTRDSDKYNSMQVIPYGPDREVLRVHVNHYVVERAGAALVRLGLPRNAIRASDPRMEFSAMPEELNTVAEWLANVALTGSTALLQDCPVPLSEGNPSLGYQWTRAADKAQEKADRSRGKRS